MSKLKKEQGIERGVPSVEINGRAEQGPAIPFEDPSFGDSVEVAVIMGR
jgi:hypothetical protein